MVSFSFQTRKHVFMKKKIFRFKQFTIEQTHAPMKIGTDSDLLGTMAYGGKNILDIGTGTGILTLMMAQRFPEARFTAVEIDENAVLDASKNFSSSPWSERIKLVHNSFQNFIEKEISEGRQERFDAIICNPPFFDKSLECPEQGRQRARHTSSLPFDTLIDGAFKMLEEGGVFSLILPPEVLENFCSKAIERGFTLKEKNGIQTLPGNFPKRYILVFRKSPNTSFCVSENIFSMRNTDNTYSQWYNDLLRDFLIPL